MHPWGKWGNDFTEYGLVAARAALNDAGLSWPEVQYVAGADTIRNGYPGFIAGATFAQKLGWTGVRVSSSYAACASGAQAIQNARADPRRLLRRRARDRCRHHTEGLLRPGRRGTQDRPRLVALPPARRDQPHVLRAVRASPYRHVRRHRRRLRAGEGEERVTASRTRTRASARRAPSTTSSRARWSPTRCASSTSAPPPTAPPR